ncbi:hypothetical protein BGM26_00440 [Bacillus sp. FJAT-29790]|uniref:hypothetical protein n=1 Tax=Bacillus sp. FJAT-29790 TaxID=1895002 RepID=UPI001C212F38|nr:hypothetical protein [Bacillus sp. FJAT-29790]MBU8877454.1 hypothetical protein [Bacillus sp. FJAT-29790]
MERAVIIGAFEFLGFHFCTSLLEQGYEVEGVHFDNPEGDPFLIDKRMAVGRNANFNEKEYQTWLPFAEIDQQTLIIIDFYDFYVQDNRNFFAESDFLEHFFGENAIQIKETDSRIVFLLPIQWHSSTSEPIHRYLMNDQISSQCFYLPTVYGPWQPSAFVFQQFLLKSMHGEKQISLNDREWIYDVLYIDEVVEAILMLAETKSAASCILKSDITDYWQKCASQLSIPLEAINKYERNRPPEPRTINVKTLKSHIDFSEGIGKQRRHLELLLDKGF